MSDILTKTKRTARNKRGSLLLLTVTVLVITAVIGMAFLQQVKMDRFATVTHERSYIDLVINGILSETREKLREDNYENFDLGRVLYDYPWTDYTNIWNVTNGSGATVQARGSVKDDRYLASTSPIVSDLGTSPNHLNWLHLTNCGGIWLDLPAIGSTETLARETLIVDRTNWEFSDTNIPGSFLADSHINASTYEPRGYDADNDGILDSRWTWAPTSVRNLGGRTYVMALRIVDLNSMINVNTATAATGNGSSPLLDSSTRGYNPTNADLTRLLFQTGMAPWNTNLDNVLTFRQTDVIWPTPTAWPFTPNERKTIWDTQAGLYGNISGHYRMASEIELRHKAGLQNVDVNADIEDINSGMADVLRNNPPDAMTESWAFLASNMHDWFFGGVDSDPVKDRMFPAIRHMLTAASGTGTYTTKYSQFGPGGRYKFDPNQANYLEIRERIQAVFEHPQSDPTAWYLAADPTVSLSPGRIDQLITEYTLAIMDYCDTDNIPSTPPSNPPLPGSGTYYGLERLPFLREVYIQALFDDKDIADAVGLRPGDVGYAGPDGQFDTWAYDASATGVNGDTQAMAIELGNPFTHTIAGASLEGDSFMSDPARVRIVVKQNSVIVSAWELGQALPAGSIPDIGPRNDAATSDLLMIYSPPANNVGVGNGAIGPGTYDGSELPTDLGFETLARVATPSGQLSFTVGGGVIDIELEVDVNIIPGNPAQWVVYDRLETNISLPAVNIPHAPNAIRNFQHAQASFARDGTNLNYLVEDGSAIGSTTNPSSGGYSNTTDQFGNDNKGPSINNPALYANLQLPHNDGQCRSIAELGWLIMFGFTDGPTGQTFTERLATIHPLLWFLDIRTDPLLPVPSGPGDSGLPHAAMLFDQFTTISPASDNLDNDNEDGDENHATDYDTSDSSGPKEIFIPGTINVNTAPLHILTLAAPMPEMIDDIEDLMRTMVSYRDAPQREIEGNFDPSTPFLDSDIRNEIRVAGDRLSHPGIASLGELLFLDPTAGINPTFDMQRYGTNLVPDTGFPVDIYPDPDDAPPLNNTTDDPEEALARFQFLSQTYTVRSDRFVVYGEVRGYEIGQFNLGPIETGKFIAVLDRGSMRVGDTTAPNYAPPRVIGFTRLQ